MSSLPRRVLVAYAAPGFALALVGIPVYIHLPKFYADTLGVDLAWMGVLILASRAWDAFTDPAIGFLSDRVRTGLGRRRPFLVLGAPPLGIAAVLLLWPPANLSPAALTWWFGGWLFVVFLAWTAVQIPHAALGAELTANHHERTSLFAARDGLWIVGTLVAAAAPSLVRAVLGVPAGETGDRQTFRFLAIAYAPLLVGLPLWCAAVVREPPRRATPNRTPWRSTADAWHNGPFRILLLAYGVGSIGAALPATLVLFYVEHVLRAPGLAEVFLSLYFVSGFAFLPAWTRVARRTGKKAAWLWAMAVNVGAFVFALFLGPGDVVEFGAVCVASGIGFGAGLVLPNSLVSDAIDFDELQSGQRRDGLYFGLWSIVTKLSAAVGAAAALPVLKWSGYVAQGEQPETALLALRLLYAAVPIACYAAGLALAARFPIGEEEHRHIRAAIDARDRGTEGARP